MSDWDTCDEIKNVNGPQAILTTMRELRRVAPHDEGIRESVLIRRAVKNVENLSQKEAEEALETLRRYGEVYEPQKGRIRLV